MKWKRFALSFFIVFFFGGLESLYGGDDYAALIGVCFLESVSMKYGVLRSIPFLVVCVCVCVCLPDTKIKDGNIEFLPKLWLF